MLLNNKYYAMQKETKSITIRISLKKMARQKIFKNH